MPKEKVLGIRYIHNIDTSARASVSGGGNCLFAKNEFIEIKIAQIFVQWFS